jgi:hypothetical protein
LLRPGLFIIIFFFAGAFTFASAGEFGSGGRRDSSNPVPR